MTVDPLRPVVAAAAAVLLAAAVAPPDNPDDPFFGMLSQDRVNVGPPDQAIAIAHQRCDDGGLSHAPFYNFRWAGSKTRSPSQCRNSTANCNRRVWTNRRWTSS